MEFCNLVVYYEVTPCTVEMGEISVATEAIQ